MSKPLVVTYAVYSTPWAINDALVRLGTNPMMSFDIETSGLYSKEQRKEAIKLLDKDLDTYHHKLVSVVANNSGLSFPEITRTTHFVFGLCRQTAVVIVVPNRHMELLVWNWLRNYRGKLLIHNALFDLKMMYHRVGDLPNDYDDTMLMLKVLINNSDVWKSKTGLKEIMGEYYPPAWSVFNEYEPEDPKDESFLEYAAIDGAATYHLYELILERS
jgi:hypothetical protein